MIYDLRFKEAAALAALAVAVAGAQAKPAVFLMPDGRTLSISPISDYWNTNFIADDWLLVWAQPGHTNWNGTYFELMTQLGNDPRLLAALAANGAVGPQGPQGPQGPAGNDGAAGASGTNGASGPAGTNLVTFSAFPSASNLWTLDDQVQTISLAGNGSVTQVYAPAPFNYGTLWVSNSSGNSNTFYVKAAINFPGIWPSNMIVIPPGQMAVISCLCLPGAWTNFAYLPR